MWTVYELANRRGPGAVYKYWAWYGGSGFGWPPQAYSGRAGCWVIAGTWPPPGGSCSPSSMALRVGTPALRGFLFVGGTVRGFSFAYGSSRGYSFALVLGRGFFFVGGSVRGFNLAFVRVRGYWSGLSLNFLGLRGFCVLLDGVFQAGCCFVL